MMHHSTTNNPESGPTSPIPAPRCCGAAQGAIEIHRVSIAYGDRTVLRDVSLVVPPRTVTAIVGPSGCGKSSLLASINRMTDLIDGCRVDGEISCCGSRIRDSEIDLRDLRRRAGLVFQRPTPFPLSIAENLALPIREHGLADRREMQDCIRRALTDVGLWEEVEDRLHAPARTLSGGQQQRLCIARALVLQPDVLLLDEPCSGLDPISTEKIEALVRSLADRISIVIVTHNLPQARRIADRTAFFWVEEGCGVLVEEGETQQIFESPRHPLTAAYVSGRAG
ncbi:MAG: phosphate ABC transporter ATP-binding protein [Planctomycetota bacterium]|nr:MAG: phosphate ABC transporter ATP-binding protein [Planctomycetota bacterium]